MLALWLMLVGCYPLAGVWEGEAECYGFDLDIQVTLEPADGVYAGSGSLDCSKTWGSDCEQTFDLELEPESWRGEQDLEVDLDDCQLHTDDGTEDVSCDDPDDLEWDGADRIEGEWSGCDIELERE